MKLVSFSWEAACIIERSVEPGILRRRLEETTVILGRPVRRTSEADELTDREQDVLRLLDERRTKREIGAALFLSYNTIDPHRNRSTASWAPPDGRMLSRKQPSSH